MKEPESPRLAPIEMWDHLKCAEELPINNQEGNLALEKWNNFLDGFVLSHLPKEVTSFIPSSKDKAPLKMSAVISPTLKPAVATQFFTESGNSE